MTRRAIFRTRTFGRRVIPLDAALTAPAPSVGDDMKLFFMTFMGGFVFMTVYLA